MSKLPMEISINGELYFSHKLYNKKLHETFHRGYDAGQAIANESTSAVDRRQSFKEGYDEGYAEGEHQGYIKGCNNYKQDDNVLTKCYNKGFTDGYNVCVDEHDIGGGNKVVEDELKYYEKKGVLNYEPFIVNEHKVVEKTYKSYDEDETIYEIIPKDFIEKLDEMGYTIIKKSSKDEIS